MGTFKKYFHKPQTDESQMGLAVINARLLKNDKKELKEICEEICSLKDDDYVSQWRLCNNKEYREMMGKLSDWGKLHGYIF